ncbi:MAG TPA: diacylglycerol kinase family protein [Thermoleophilaceae bacterium]|nr:diacylglycerol kinase family protein [Thermoleophilaceae bacterium]
MTRRFVLLVNPASAGGRALKALPAVIAELDAHGAEHRTVTTRSTEHAAEESHRAADAGESVMALGGDGLLRPVAGALSGRDTAVAIVPCGRGNDFARVLGVPKDPAAAARLAVRGRERPVDVATVDGTPYLGIASLGIDSDANKIANDARLLRGDAVYFYAGLRALAAWRPAAFTVTIDGERHEVTGYSVAVGNSRAYGGGMFLLPHAEIDDGKLDVLMIESFAKLRLLRAHLPGVYRGTHLTRHHRLARGEVVEVQSDRPFEVYADGDPIGATPATMRVERRALRVIAPPES